MIRKENPHLFKADNEKALKKALEMEKRVDKSNNLLKRCMGEKWEERAVNVLTKERNTYLKSLKEFTQFNFLRTGETSVKGWSNTIFKEKFYCALK